MSRGLTSVRFLTSLQQIAGAWYVCQSAAPARRQSQPNVSQTQPERIVETCVGISRLQRCSCMVSRTSRSQPHDSGRATIPPAQCDASPGRTLCGIDGLNLARARWPHIGGDLSIEW